MVYLRGTFNKYAQRTPAGKPTLQNQINQLKYKVGQNKREIQYRTSSIRPIQADGIPNNVKTTEFDVEDDLVTDPAFRDFVNGDKWRNHWLEIHVTFSHNKMNSCRMIVYRPVRVDDALPQLSLTGHLDRSRFMVLYDQFINPTDTFTTELQGRRKMMGLKNLVTQYNSSTQVIEKGALRIAFITAENSTANNGDTMVGMSFQHAFSNK